MGLSYSLSVCWGGMQNVSAFLCSSKSDIHFFWGRVFIAEFKSRSLTQVGVRLELSRSSVHAQCDAFQPKSLPSFFFVIRRKCHVMMIYPGRTTRPFLLDTNLSLVSVWFSRRCGHSIPKRHQNAEKHNTEQGSRLKSFLSSEMKSDFFWYSPSERNCLIEYFSLL